MTTYAQQSMNHRCMEDTAIGGTTAGSGGSSSCLSRLLHPLRGRAITQVSYARVCPSCNNPCNNYQNSCKLRISLFQCWGFCWCQIRQLQRPQFLETCACQYIQQTVRATFLNSHWSVVALSTSCAQVHSLPPQAAIVHASERIP